MKIGSIGTGSIVDKFMDAITKVENVSINAMYSRKESSALKLSTKYSVPNIYTSLEEFMKDKNIDTVYIASPNSLHYEQSKLALLAGKHVICEKPLCTTTEELKELMGIANERKLFFFEAIKTIHLPNYIEMKKKLELIGSIHMVECNFSKYSSRYTDFINGKTPNVFNPAFSGGALADLNIYNLHFVMNTFGIPMNYQYFPTIQRDIDVDGIAILKYDHFQAVCIASKNCNGINYGQIMGEKGTIYVHGTSTALQVDLIINGDKTSYTIQNESNGMFYELQNFEYIVQNKDYSTCYELLEYSYQVLKVMQDLRDSSGIKHCYTK